jgi:hypothetical protein
MEKQQIFKEKYVLKLKDEIKADKYRSAEFLYDKKQTLMMPNIDKPVGLLDKLDHESDLTSAIAIFEAFKRLEPIQASDERFWVYLAHVDLYSYMVKRWPKVYTGNESKPENYIKDHWFIGNSSQTNLMRHSLAGLWWSVYLSVDEQRENKYELTEVLFWNQTFRTRTFGNYKLVRHKEAVIGLLEFCKENKSLLNNFEKQHQLLTEYLNLIGGTKPLAYYNRFYFKNELSKINFLTSRS